MTQLVQQPRRGITDARELLHDGLALLEPAIGLGSGRAEKPAKVFGEGFDRGLSRRANVRDRGYLASYFPRFVRSSTTLLDLAPYSGMFS
jgi:hypothetical protein